ncbi:ATP-grasp fold amidoligase family protein [Mycolicibacterium elephantis]
MDKQHTPSSRIKEDFRARLNSFGRTAIRSLPLPTRRRILYYYTQRKRLNLDPPRSFNEKVNWRIINDRRPLIAETCDKLKAKDFAAERGINAPRLIWHGTNLGELVSINLPDRWVLKPNHRSGVVYFGSAQPDLHDVKCRTQNWLAETQWAEYGEWAYAEAQRCFIVEERLGQQGEDLPDYKFYVFDGRVELIQVDSDRHTNHQRRLYTPDWQPLDVEFLYPLAPKRSRPDRLSDMLDAAKVLGAGFDMIRVDLYVDGDAIWFGEMTPYPDGGRGPFRPEELDYQLGSLWKLPSL